MKNENRRVAIVGGARIPFAKSWTAYNHVSNYELMAGALTALVKKYKLEGQTLGDVAVGSVNHNSADWNFARETALESGLGPKTPAFNVSRACGSSLESTGLIGAKISMGQIEAGIAGGSDTNSDLPLLMKRALSWKLMDLKNARSTGDKIKLLASLRPGDLMPQFPAVVEARTGMSMGEHCEKMVQEWQISREDQDKLTLASHKNAGKAYDEGFFDDLVFPFKSLKRDALVRKDSTLEKMAKLKPVFDFTGKGTLTAANSTALSDGAAAVLLASEAWAKKNNQPVLAYLKDIQASAVDFVGGEGLLMAPTSAVAQLLERNNMKFQDFDYYEIHEAFAGQVLCTLKAWESDDYCKKRLGLSKALGSLDYAKLNVAGGSVALGHPFAATGARLVASGAKLLAKKGSGKLLISVCTGGGMGVAAILEL